MSIEMSGATAGNMAWNVFNTLLGAAGVATGSTALGSKTSTDKVKEIIREEMGECGCGHNHYGYRNGSGYGCENPLVNRFELLQNQEISRLQAKE